MEEVNFVEAAKYTYEERAESKQTALSWFFRLSKQNNFFLNRNAPYELKVYAYQSERPDKVSKFLETWV